MTGGRPLRFLAIVLGGWIGMRTLALFQTGDLPLAPLTNPVEHIVAALGIGPAEAAARPPLPTSGATPVPRPNRPPIAPPPAPSCIPTAAARTDGDRPAPATTTTTLHATPPPPLLPLATPAAITPRGPSRLAGSVWGITRDGGIGQASGGQLGGSQAGIRVTYALGASRRIALATRLSTPLAGRGAEAALGLDWQPT